MDQTKVEMFVLTNAKKFESHIMPQITEALQSMDESRFLAISSIDYKEPQTMLIISLLAGPLGVDRFMLGETGLGVAKLLTFGGCGIWTIIDWFSIQKKTKEYNLNLFQQAVAM